MKRICHLTSLHNRNDSRIFHKELVSLSNYFETYLITADEKGNDLSCNIKIYDVSNNKKYGRLKHFLIIPKLIYQKALEIDCEVYHFHDPNLLPVGYKLLKRGKKVIYDAHEDLPRDILYKSYIPVFFRSAISRFAELYENRICKSLSAVIASTPHIKDRFKKINQNTFDIKNYPLINELHNPISWQNKNSDICYIGGISKERGIFEMTGALKSIDGKLHLAGNFESEALRSRIMNEKYWPKVIEYGYVEQGVIKKIMNRCKVGLVILHPIITYIDSLPIKLFEYMSAGIPVVCSNFPLWKEIVEKNNCGICVNPGSISEISEAVNYLINNDQKAQEMGQNARKTIETLYNWEIEKKKLIEIYYKILK